MAGYQIMTAIDERTNGAWKPSPGAIYPALQRLTHRNLIEPLEEAGDDKQRYQLTEEGRRRVTEMVEAGLDEPWAELVESDDGTLRSAAAEIVGPLRQIGRFGTSEQKAEAQRIIGEATSKLYRLLADGAEQAEQAEQAEAEQAE